MVNIVVVSHSAKLADGVAELAAQMTQNGCRLVVAAGVDDPDHPIGTDAIKVMQAIEEVFDPSGVLIMMDLGSALLSTETALELLDPEMSARVKACSAPIVEGTLAAVVAASAGASLAEVEREAQSALQAKKAQLGEEEPQAKEMASESPTLHSDERGVSWKINNPNGLHVRPAAKLATAMAPFDAELVLYKLDSVKGNRHADPRSLNQLALLQIRKDDEIRLVAKGSQADEALAAFKQLAESNFGESIAPDTSAGQILQGKSVMDTQVSAPAFVLPTQDVEVPDRQILSDRIEIEQQRLRQAIAKTLQDLSRLADRTNQLLGKQHAGIFGAHSMLIDDPDLQNSAFSRIASSLCSAEIAWQTELTEMADAYRELDDEYLQARELDVRDILQRTLLHLAGETQEIQNPSVPSILLARELMPSDTIMLDRRLVQGIVLSQGNALSHSAILANALGIPMIVGVGDSLKQAQEGQKITLNAARGEVILGR
ncbi:MULTISPECIES: dihydroxyacetone kinase phosphoryl donor subunit DhaM [Hafnia]|uniref:phosphoenolpyruvate--glycerone phosphotransferase n=2 Tax=Hafnia TaxID=568 RepID=A0A4V6MSW3_9GAMM|nr:MULTISPECIES: dihydroxyacetone kinase phosphoryl donor subunit DhaM [Hafnia]AJR01811.1 Phosphoenolpyruvate-dihydroxyacetone phosphotransferase, subunit DhaM; DHA-specific IIA component/DHA-specific phosphocarrier protein HPr/DHA-specific EI component [Enterobacteriaceae bacterium bta3-1]EHM41364.1 dihydroxyacetone kinase, phosphotransfer subunit [Hafnia alvei ATCC 51873]QQE42384.1 dihydroxyacetone kinase subunit DhaM [Hafnia alvei]TBM29942.1 dihydroxyacetone kinase subunit DhaM [Hafnia paral